MRRSISVIALLLIGCLNEEPAPPRTIGASCTDNKECQTDLCLGNLPGGYCSQLCGDNATCPPGRSCATEGSPSFCLDACETAAGCREGYACRGGLCDPTCQQDSDCRIE